MAKPAVARALRDRLGQHREHLPRRTRRRPSNEGDPSGEIRRERARGPATARAAKEEEGAPCGPSDRARHPGACGGLRTRLCEVVPKLPCGVGGGPEGDSAEGLTARSFSRGPEESSSHL